MSGSNYCFLICIRFLRRQVWYLFHIFHINGIIYHVAFYEWLLSLSIIFSSFIHVVACFSTSFLFMTEQYSTVWTYHYCLSFHQLMNICSCYHFWTTMNNDGINVCVQVSVWTCFQVSRGCIYVGVELLGHIRTLYRASLATQMVKNLPAMQETQVRSLGREKSPREGKGYALQYSGLENPMDRGAWWAAHGATTEQLSAPHFHFHILPC